MKPPVFLLPFALSLGVHAGFLAYGLPGGDARLPVEDGKYVMTLNIRQARPGPAVEPAPGKDRIGRLPPATAVSRPADPPPPAIPKQKATRKPKEDPIPADAPLAVARSADVLNEPESKDSETATVAAADAGAPEEGWDQPDDPDDPPQPTVRENIPVAGDAVPNEGALVSARAVSLVKPAYPHRARQQGQEGSVTLGVDILPDGRPMNIRVIQTSGHRLLDRAAMQALAESRFAPARLGDSPVKTRKRIKFTFDLKGPSR